MPGLTKALAIKSTFDVIFVGLVTLGFYFSVFPTTFRGSLDVAEPGRVAGWAMDLADPGTPIRVQLYLNGSFFAEAKADVERPDVVAAGLANEQKHGYSFPIPKLSPGTYEARVYGQNESSGGKLVSLQEIGLPMRFDVR